MFGTLAIEDQIPVFPSELSSFNNGSIKETFCRNSKIKDPLLILRNRINEKYLNKVLRNTGLMISFVGFDEVDHAEIDTDDGGLLFNVLFRMIVFRPYIGEVIEGIVIDSDSTGLTVSLGFFNDIKIPCNDLREPKSIDPNTKIWSWDYENHKLCYFIDSTIRFRVTSIIFNDQSQDESLSSMVIIGNVQSDGLGMISWWN